MKILVAPDKFKGTVTAPEIVSILAPLLEQHGHTVTGCPLADGGDGTAEILTIATEGRTKTIQVEGPDFSQIYASYGINDQTGTAYIEMASASGLALLDEEKRNPLDTSTTGVGMLLLDAIKEGCTEVVLGVGGSATNDGGIGVAHILGFQFLNKEGQSLLPVGRNLIDIQRIIPPKTLPKIKITVAVDVLNPFYGPNGAAFTYAQQKGAGPEEIIQLDNGLQNLAKRFKESLDVSIGNLPGSGAAGGLAGGLVACIEAELNSGIDLVMSQVGFDERLAGSDLVISGEGKLDNTSFQGKVVGEVIKRAKTAGKSWLAICGQTSIHKQNIFSLSNAAGSSEEALKNPHFWLRTVLVSQVVPYLQRSV